MVSVSRDLSCELRRFTTSQFRSKVYTVPVSECYPVAPTVFAQAPPGPIRGLDKPSPSDSDEDNVPVLPPTTHSTVPTPSQVVTAPPAYDKPTIPEPVHDVIPVQELPPVPTAIVPAPCIPDSSPVPSAALPQPPEPAVVTSPRRYSRHAVRHFGTTLTGY
ncbi:uncharacterized protein LOC144655167 [Oculina patagonica]